MDHRTQDHIVRGSQSWIPWGVGIFLVLVVVLLVSLILFFMIKVDKIQQPTTIYKDSNSDKIVTLPGLETGLSSRVLASYGFDKNKSGLDQNEKLATEPIASQKLDNGMRVEEFYSGDGVKTTKAGDTVAIHYIGYLGDGRIFDSSIKGEKKPLVFKLESGSVIVGVDIGLRQMKVGAVRRLYIPSNLAYGNKAIQGVIPPNSDLVFDIQLIAIR